MFREIFRRSCREIPGQLDIVVNAKADCTGIGYIELRAEFLNAVQRFFI
jgi:ribonuclease P protein component